MVSTLLELQSSRCCGSCSGLSPFSLCGRDKNPILDTYLGWHQVKGTCDQSI
ncbi:MAG: hypothetical protein ACK51L_04795 [bacterium]